MLKSYGAKKYTYNFIISQNKVAFVNEIKDKEIKDGGKLSKGKNYSNNETVRILDKDYGKSAELMRYLLEDEDRTPLRKKVLIFGLIGFIVFIGAIFLINSLKQTQVTEQKTNGILPSNPVVSTQTTQVQAVTRPEAITNPTVSPAPSIIEPPLGSQQKDNSKDIEILQLKYEIEKSKIDTLKIIEEKNIIVNENYRLSQIITEKESIIKDLQAKIAENPKNLGQDDFLLYLGYKVYQQCEKAVKNDEINKCESLYFNYVKNEG